MIMSQSRPRRGARSTEGFETRTETLRHTLRRFVLAQNWELDAGEIVFVEAPASRPSGSRRTSTPAGASSAATSNARAVTAAIMGAAR
jgi:hypothetical protein